MRNHLILAITVSLLTSASIVASGAGKKKRKRPPINPNKQVDINYGNASWNQDSSKIDVATLIIRDGRSGKIVLINLSENGPDESVFKGRFSVGWGTADALIPEVYIPSQKEMATAAGKKNIIEKIRKKSLGRKPFILTRGENGQQVIEVFDTRKQAKMALKNYRQQIKLRKQAELPVEVASKASLEVAEQLRIAKLEQERKQNALDAEAERIRLKQLEQKRKLERLRAQKALAKAEVLRRKKLAKKLSLEAIQLYKQGSYAEALKKFEEAVEMDPANKSYYYAYGVTLYSNKKFNKAIVIFNSIKSDKNINAAEKSYYHGMALYRIKDFENSIKQLSIAQNYKVEPLSSSSAFYVGMSRYAKKAWEPAKESFQWVLDNSKDPKLDERSDEMIERITKIQHFEKNKEKQHILTAGLGLQYDSNVLLQADNSSNATGSDIADFRFTGIAGYQWRPLFTKDREWSVKSNLVYIYSMKSANATADPMLVSLSAPYILKGKNKAGKGYKSEISPKFDMLYMDPSEGKNRKDILDTWGVDWKNTIIQREDRFTNYNMSLVYNNSHISTGDDNSDGTSIALGYGNTWFLDKKKSRGLVQDNELTYYSAKGINQKYYKLSSSVSYLKPLNWKNFTSIAKASFYYASYPNSTASRSDTNIGLNYLLTKKLNNVWSFVGGASYTKNSSSESSKSYSKFVINSMVTGSWKF